MQTVKAVSKKIIEINEPEHEYIEKIYVILKPKSPQVSITKRKSEAQQYVSNLVCWRRTLLPFNKKIRLALLFMAIILVASVFLYLIL